MPVPQTVLAADLGGTKLSAALVDRRGRILARTTEPVDRSSSTAPVEQICRLAAVLTRSGRQPTRVLAAGVAVPGLVRRTGTVWAPNLPGWERVPLARLLGRRLGVRVAVESDRNAAVLGEAWRGAARGKSDVIILLVGTGIGAGILSGGALLRGAHELSGCAGWMVLGERQTKATRRVGWLEASAAGPAITRAARRLGVSRRPFTAQALARSARRGDARARKIFARAGRLLGLAVANLTSLFDPEVVVLGGGLAGAADLYLPALRKAALEHCQPLAARHVSIRVSRLGGDANLLGAARLAWEAARPRRRAAPGRGRSSTKHKKGAT